MAHEDTLTRSQRTLLKQIARDDKAMLSTLEGRRVLMRLIDSTGVFQRSYVSGDALGTSHREGRRSVGLELIDQIEAAEPGIFARMQQEALALRQANERQDKNTEVDDEDE